MEVTDPARRLRLQRGGYGSGAAVFLAVRPVVGENILGVLLAICTVVGGNILDVRILEKIPSTF